MSEHPLSDENDHDCPPDDGGPEMSYPPGHDPGPDPVIHLHSPPHGRRLAPPWQTRVPISAEERRRFEESVKEEVAKREGSGYDAREGDEQHTDKAKRQREAISAALLAQGYLTYTRRRIPLPISRHKVT
jgi:hypothetical protein